MYEYNATGLGFTNWRTSPGDPCSEISGGQQRCFRTTEVNGQAAEQEFAAVQGCLSRQEPCNTSYGNPCIVWCCPPGWPLQPGSPPLEPGERPPEQPTEASSLLRVVAPVVGVAALGAAGFFYWKSRR